MNTPRFLDCQLNGLDTVTYQPSASLIEQDPEVIPDVDIAGQVGKDLFLDEVFQKWLSTKKRAPHGDPRPDILSPWRRRLSLPIPCHVH